LRPLTDRMRVSREKLAWLVDSTAAPVAGLSVLSTWIAYEISQFEPQLPAAGFAAGSGFSVFLQTIPFRFYCILTLVFVGAMSIAGRDFGPMLKAERRAWTTGAVFRPGARPMSAEGDVSAEPKPDIVHLAHVALLPVAITLGTIIGLFIHQGEAVHAAAAGVPGHVGTGFSFLHIREILEGVTDNTILLFIGSVAGLVSAVLLALVHRLLSLRESIQAALSGSRAMSVAVAILMLAWAMAAVCGDIEGGGLGTREYMASIAPLIPPLLLPAGLFALACGVAFATGSSWSTMGILLPIVIGLAASVGEGSSIGSQGMVIITIGAVLDGSIFGDHCSPISDTTILSSTAAGSDHMDHVRTQAPYAICVMLLALFVGYLPAAAGFPPSLSLGLGVLAIAAIVAFVAKPVVE
jgi:Na+/H+ antiporter NhaC